MLFNVQVLRGIAATLVVWVHTQELITGDILPHWLRSFGYGGVDLFFVIGVSSWSAQRKTRISVRLPFLEAHFSRRATLLLCHVPGCGDEHRNA